VAGKARRILVIGDVQRGTLVDMRLPIDPLDLDTLLLEQAFVVGDELGEPLERRGILQAQGLH
jgi:hypothetical protein